MAATWKLDHLITFLHKRFLSPNFQSTAMSFRPFSMKLSVTREISRPIPHGACDTSNFRGRDCDIPKSYEMNLPLRVEFLKILIIIGS